MNSYELRVREFEENDIGHDCKFMPDHGSFQMHLDALIEDIFSLEQIAKVENRGDYIAIESQTELQECEAIMEPVFKRFFCKIRCVSIKKV